MNGENYMSLIVLGGSINSEAMCRPNKREKKRCETFLLKTKRWKPCILTRDKVQKNILIVINLVF
jgi:hypothetical protein